MLREINTILSKMNLPPHSPKLQYTFRYCFRTVYVHAPDFKHTSFWKAVGLRMGREFIREASTGGGRRIQHTFTADMRMLACCKVGYQYA